jgi:Family of unknown function (DUF6152)
VKWDYTTAPLDSLRRRLALLLAIVSVVGFLGLLDPARAHHGDANRYVQDVIDVAGTVVELKMVNPHAHIIFDAEEGGKTVRWQAELVRR